MSWWNWQRQKVGIMGKPNELSWRVGANHPQPWDLICSSFRIGKMRVSIAHDCSSRYALPSWNKGIPKMATNQQYWLPTHWLHSKKYCSHAKSYWSLREFSRYSANKKELPQPLLQLIHLPFLILWDPKLAKKSHHLNKSQHIFGCKIVVPWYLPS